MGIADMGEFRYQDIVDPTLLASPDDPAVLGSSLDKIYPFDIREATPLTHPRLM